jgi:hypothetical protein
MAILGIEETEGPGPEEYRVSDQEILREYEISLRFLHKGMNIRVGCKEIAFSDTKEGLEELNKYLANPNEEQTKWRKLLNN